MLEKLKKLLLFSIILTTLIIIIWPFAIIYLLNNGNPYTKYLANKHIPIYFEEKGYTKEDILEKRYVEDNKGVFNEDFYRGHFMVIYKDEPNVKYFYGLTKDGKHVKQFCEKVKFIEHRWTSVDDINTKHSDPHCVNHRQ
jgi:hypothetical protein